MAITLHRRQFFRDGILLTTGLVSGAMVPRFLSGWHEASSVQAADELESASAEQRLKNLGIELPPAPKPVAVYVPGVVSGNMLYASGHGPRTTEGKLFEAALVTT